MSREMRARRRHSRGQLRQRRYAVWGTGAFWALLGPEVDLRRTEYNLGAAAERLRTSGFAEIEQFIAQNVLTTPAAEDVLAAFAAADGR